MNPAPKGFSIFSQIRDILATLLLFKNMKNSVKIFISYLPATNFSAVSEMRRYFHDTRTYNEVSVLAHTCTRWNGVRQCLYCGPWHRHGSAAWHHTHNAHEYTATRTQKAAEYIVEENAAADTEWSKKKRNVDGIIIEWSDCGWYMAASHATHSHRQNGSVHVAIVLVLMPRAASAGVYAATAKASPATTKYNRTCRWAQPVLKAISRRTLDNDSAHSPQIDTTPIVATCFRVNSLSATPPRI